MTHRIAAFAVAFSLAAGTAAAQANLEYGPEYEAGFRTACAASFGARDCQCALEGLQRRAGYAAFADAMARHGGEFFARSPLAPTAVALLEGCAGSVAAAPAPPSVRLVVEAASVTPSMAAVAVELCRAREAAVVPGIKALIDRPDPRGTAELQAVVGNLARAREHCAAGDLDRAFATYDHVAVFLAAGGFGDDATAR